MAPNSSSYSHPQAELGPRPGRPPCPPYPAALGHLRVDGPRPRAPPSAAPIPASRVSPPRPPPAKSEISASSLPPRGTSPGRSHRCREGSTSAEPPRTPGPSPSAPPPTSRPGAQGLGAPRRAPRTRLSGARPPRGRPCRWASPRSPASSSPPRAKFHPDFGPQTLPSPVNEEEAGPALRASRRCRPLAPPPPPRPRCRLRCRPRPRPAARTH